jgi:cytochrome P450
MSSAHDHSTDEVDLLSPALFAGEGYPYAHWDRLRRESPISQRFHGGEPYWAITKHADITSIGRQPDLFLNGPKLIIRESYGSEDFVRPTTLIEQDNPLHRKSRKLISNRFTPRALKAIHGDIERIAKQIVDDLLEMGSETSVEFVEKVSAPLPIAVIAWLLGVPQPDWNLIFDWTNRIIGVDDPEYHPEGMTKEEDGEAAMMELFTYFAALVEERRKKPQEDLITLFTKAEIDGKPLEMIDILAWCQIIMVAGNETTRNATSGGLLAFIENSRRLFVGPARSFISRGPPLETPRSAASRSRRTIRSVSSIPRRTATRTSSTIPTRSASTACRIAIWASGWASISAPAPISLDSSSRWRSSTCCPGSRRSSSRARWTGSTRIS